MTIPEGLESLLYAAFAAGGAWAAVRVELRHVWRKLGEHGKAIDRAHTRIDQVFTDVRN